MKRKILLILFSIVATVCMGLFFTACGQSTQYSELEMEEGIVYLTDYSVKYTSDEESPLGNVNESSLSEEKSGSVQTYYLVMDFDIQTAEDILGMEWLTVTMKVLDADVVKATINYTNTSSTQEITSNGETTITATYSLPEKAKELKNVSLVVELRSQNVGATDIVFSFESDNKLVTGYSEEDSTYILSDDSVNIKNTSFEYTLNSNGQSYSVKSIGTKSGAMQVADTYNDLPITAIADSAFANCTSITKITLPESITEIGKSAFKSCTSLKSVTIGDNVTTIGESAFADCTSLSSATIGESVTSIGASAFSNCTALTEIVIPDGVSAINDNTFYNCSSLVSATIPDSVTIIGTSAFDNCTALVEIEIPDSVTSIGNSAFNLCSSMTSATIGENVTTIGESAFTNCTALSSVTIGESVTIIGTSAFYNCTALAEIKFNATAMEDLASDSSVFADARQSGHGITVTIGANVTKIPAYLFYDSSKLKSVVFEENSKCESIGDDAFYNCTSLSSVAIGESVTTIGTSAFSNCTALTEIIIPDSVTSIDNYAFYGCSSLTSVTIGSGVKTIDTYAFSNCASLAGVYITDIASWCNITFSDDYSNPLYYAGNLYLNGSIVTDVVISDGVTSIGDRAFKNCSSLKSVTIPDSVTSIGDSAFYECTSLTSVTIGNGVTKIGSEAFRYCPSLTSVTIGDSVTTIGDCAFEECEYLASITIPNSVITIGDSAFFGCSSLMSVYYTGTASQWASISFSNNSANPLSYAGKLYLNGTLAEDITLSGVTSINAYAFYNCTSLTSITIPDTVTSIGSYTFYNCSSLASITIPDSVTTIGNSAFYDCTSLKSITIPDSVTTIGSGAFAGCSSLESITLPFVGGSASATGASSSTLFGYIFGTKSYTGGTATEQYYGYNSCTTYYIPATLTTVTITGGNMFYGAFYHCRSLESIEIPNSVTTIGDYAFYWCTSLTSITIPDSVTSIGERAFYDCASSEVYITDIASWCNITFRDVYSNPLCHVGNLYLNGSLVRELVIPDMVTTIGNYTFYKCNSLTCITIHNSVTTIGNYAFYYCTSLTSVTIGSSVTSIGNYAFFGCDKLFDVCNLSSFTITAESSDNGYVAYYAKNVYTTSGKSSFVTQDEYVFYNMDDSWYLLNYIGTDTELTLPDLTINGEKVSYGIYEYAFYYDTAIKSVIIPDSVTSIGDYAFCGCTSLTSITIGQSLTSIGNYAFSNCTALTEINFNATAMEDLSYSSYVFKYAGQSGDGITVTIGANVTKIPAYLFSLGTYNISGGICGEIPKITSVVFEENSKCETIGEYAFRFSTSLTSVTIGEGVTTIGGSAFYNCTALTEINFNATAMEDLFLRNYVFYGAGQSGDGITVTIGANVTKIPAYLFDPYSDSNYTPKITSVVFEENSKCEAIGDYAFWYCTSLENVYYSGTASQWASISFGNIISNPLYYAVNLYLDGTLATDITIKSITSINAYAFYNCTSLTNVTIGDGVTTIGDDAFYNCSLLTSITIPDNVTSIGSGAFAGCSSLVSITLPFVGSSADATTASESTLFGYIFGTTSYTGGTATTQYYGGSSVTYYIPATFTMVTITGGNILYGAFYNCSSLTSVTIGDSVTTIGNYAFYACTSLTSVYYKGTASEWSSIKIGSNNSWLTFAKIYYYAESGSTTVAGNYWYYDNDGNIKTWSV